MSDRFPKRLAAVPPQPPPDGSAAELQAVVDHHLVPAVLELQRATHRGDVDAIRARSLELLTHTGSVIAAVRVPTRTDRI